MDIDCGTIKRIIPAYAGSTTGSSKPNRSMLGSSPRMRGAQRVGHASRWPCEDHPRVCGEHYSDATQSPDMVGSSPRMRGAHIWCAVNRVTIGIIPAYAGSTIWGAGG